MGTRRMVPFVCVVALAVVTALGGCGESAEAGSKGEPSAAENSAVVATVASSVSLHLDVGSFSSESSRARISGTVTPGSKVTVNHHRASVHGRHWSNTIELHLGDNHVTVRATHSGRRGARKTITVTRERISAEVEAEARRGEEESEASNKSTPSSTSGASTEECTNGTYVNSAGNTVCRPENSPTAPEGATAECEDGTYSFSESRSGTCSHHGGVARWLE
ncbi:MAG: DUF3761 domain-containing protein [Solirubrobacteraceae bacterium]